MGRGQEFVARDMAPLVHSLDTSDTVTVQAHGQYPGNITTLFFDDPDHALTWLEQAADLVRQEAFGATPRERVHPLEAADAGDWVRWHDGEKWVPEPEGGAPCYYQLAAVPRSKSGPFAWDDPWVITTNGAGEFEVPAHADFRLSPSEGQVPA